MTKKDEIKDVIEMGEIAVVIYDAFKIGTVDSFEQLTSSSVFCINEDGGEDEVNYTRIDAVEMV